MKPREANIRVPRMNARRSARTRVCVRADLVGRVITIRSAYKGMHQGGNKSGAHRESICFHLHGRAAREGPTADEDGEGRHPESGGFFRAERIARSRELFMEWLLKSYGRGCPVFAKHARHRRLILSRRGKHQAPPPFSLPSSTNRIGPEIRRSRCFSWTE